MRWRRSRWARRWACRWRRCWPSCASSRACRTAPSGWRDVGGVRYVNDSKGTNVGATLAAVAGFEGPLVLIAGRRWQGPGLRAAARGLRRQGAPRAADRPRCRRRSRRRSTACCTLQYCASLEEAVRRSLARRAAGRHRAALAGLREPGHVPRLCASRRGLRARRCRGSPHERQRPAAVNRAARARAGACAWTRSPSMLVLAILLLGLVMVTSASISMAAREQRRSVLLPGAAAGC